VTAVLDVPVTAPSYGLLTDTDEIRERCESLAAEKLPFGFDVETGYHGESREGAALHAEENFLVAVQFTNSTAWARMIPLAFDSGPNADSKAVAPLLWALLHVTGDDGLPLGVPWGAIAELRWMARWFLRNLWDHPLFGKQVRADRGYFPVRSDGLLESYSEGENKSNGLKAATLDNYGYQMRELKDGPDSLLGRLLGRMPTRKEGNSVRFNVFDPADPEVIAYACEDAVWCLRHHLDRWPKVRNTFVYKVEMSVLPVVCDMADTGIAYDWNLLRATASEVHEFADRLLAEVLGDFEALAGEKLPPTFNLNSDKQFADLLYSKCGMPVLHQTPGGVPSVDAKKALPGLALKYPEVRRYLEWKRLHDLRLKFLDIWESKFNWAPDGRAHPTLMQNGTVTGRTACENPNYQNSPKKYHCELRDGTVFDFDFRDAIVATSKGARSWHEWVLMEAGCPDVPEPDEHGWYILGFDYSQQELRVLAAESGETELLEAFKRGEDVHRLTASRMLGIALAEVTKVQRQDFGKRMNFAIGYGQTPHGMHLVTGKPLAECDQLFEDFGKAYPHLKSYTRRIIRQARRDGYVRTKFGRLVRIWEFQNPSPKVRRAGERTAGNCCIQGPATGDYVKAAMVRAVRALRKAGLADKVRMVMNIHDALEFEVRADVHPAQVIAVLKDAVIFPVKGPGVEWPPLVADWHMGPSWGKLKEIHTEDGEVVLGKLEDCPRCRPVPAPEAAPEAPGRVIIELAETPQREQAAALGKLLKSLPGGNQVEVRLPGGVLPVSFPCGLGPEHAARVAVIFGAGAVVRYAAELAAV
jgi:DNA polymerase I-like protein with 3'-5' exonuclease and polymerase domains